MREYHKIHTVWLRDPATNHKTLLQGQWAKPEFEYLRANSWLFTEKVDGTNIRVMWDGEGRVTFGGKTDRAQLPSPLVARLQRLFPPDRLVDVFGHMPACLYGEGYGAGIQRGGVYRPDQDFVLFDVLVNGWWLQRSDVEDVAGKAECEVVPIVGIGPLDAMIRLVRAGLRSEWGGATAEGIVARPVVELVSRSGERIITKVKAKDFAPVAEGESAGGEP